MEWLMQQTSTGATYLQVVILALFAVFGILPIAYITIRDWAQDIKTMMRRDSDVSRD